MQDSVEQLAARGPDAPGHDRSVPPGDGADDAADAGAGAGAGPCSREPRKDGVLCVLVWLHHLKSTTKRKLICQWARELKLSGACKPGFPGAAGSGRVVQRRTLYRTPRVLLASWSASAYRDPCSGPIVAIYECYHCGALGTLAAISVAV